VFCYVRQMFVVLVTFRWIVTSGFAFTCLLFNVSVDTFHSDSRNHYVNLAMFCTTYFKYFIFPPFLKI
jgi:hypothetical protein